VGANSDVWDEALASGGGASKRGGGGSEGSNGEAAAAAAAGGGGGGTGKLVAEAGKIWAKGRNWTSVVVEVVPGMLPPEEEMVEDEDVLEMAVFVRIEYETEVAGEEKGTAQQGGGGVGGKEKREEAFWCVLGAGRIGRL